MSHHRTYTKSHFRVAIASVRLMFTEHQNLIAKVITTVVHRKCNSMNNTIHHQFLLTLLSAVYFLQE